MQNIGLSLPTSPNAFPLTSTSITLSPSNKVDTSFEISQTQLSPIKIPQSFPLQKAPDFQENLTKILQSHPRTDSQARVLFNVIKYFSFIQTLCHEIEGNNSFGVETALEVIKTMKYVRISQGKVIYKQYELSPQEMYVVYSGEVGLLVKERDIITKQNIKKLEAFKQLVISSEKAPKSSIIKDFDPLQMNHIESYLISNKVNHKRKPDDSPPRVSLSTLLKGYGRYKELIHKYSMLVKIYILLKRGHKRRQKIKKVAAKYGTLRDRIHRGGFFGESGLMNQKEYEETALALTNCEIFIVKTEDFQELWKDFHAVRMSIQKFIFENFPRLGFFKSTSIIQSLTHALEERRFDINNKIITEGSKGEYFYIVFSGECEIYKDVSIDETPASENMFSNKPSLLRVHGTTRKKVVLSAISKGVFFGEEVLFSQEKRYYTSVRAASSKVLVLAINVHHFAARFPKEVYEALKEAYHNKEIRYLETIKNLILSSYEDYELVYESSSSEKKIPISKETVRIIKNPLKLKKKKPKNLPPPSLVIEENSSSFTMRQTALSGKNPFHMSTPRKDMPSLTLVQTYRDVEPQSELPVQTQSSQYFPSAQDVNEKNRGLLSKGISLSPKMGSFGGFPKINLLPISQSTILQHTLSNPMTEGNSKTNIIFPLKSLSPVVSRKNASTEIAKDGEILLTKNYSYPVEMIGNTSPVFTHSKLNTLSPSNINALKKHFSMKLAQEHAGYIDSSLSLSTRKSQNSFRKDSRDLTTAGADRNEIELLRFDLGTSDSSKRIKEAEKRRGKTSLPSKFQESRNKEEKEQKESADDQKPQTAIGHKKTKSEFSRMTSPVGNKALKDGLMVVRFQQKLKKLKRVHLYTRSSSFSGLDEGEINVKNTKTNPSSTKNTTTKNKFTQNSLGEDIPRKECSINVLHFQTSPDNSPKKDQRVSTANFHDLIQERKQGHKNVKSCKNTKSYEEKRKLSVGSIVKPILFPVAVSRKSHRNKESASLIPNSQEETANTTNPTNLAGSTKMGSFFSSNIFSSGSFSTMNKIEEIPNNSKKSPDMKESGRLSKYGQLSLFKEQSKEMQKISVIIKKNRSKERMEVVVAKIQVHVEDIAVEPINNKYSRHSYR